MQVNVDVTQDDIDMGKARRCYDCPIALAINRTIPGAYAFVTTPAKLLTLTVDGSRVAVKVERWQSVNKFIRDFDNGLPVSPFSLTLDIPEA